VDVSGGVLEEVRVNIDLDRLQAVGVGLTVLNELEARNQDISGGRILGDSEPLTRTIGRFQEAAEMATSRLKWQIPPQEYTGYISPCLPARLCQSNGHRRTKSVRFP